MSDWSADVCSSDLAFATVCVIPHLFHMIQGARYHRQGAAHFNPYTYDDIKTIADHVHWLGDPGPHAGNFRSAAAGGGSSDERLGGKEGVSTCRSRRSQHL